MASPDDTMTVTVEDLQQECPLIRAHIKTLCIPEMLIGLAKGPYGMTTSHLSLLDFMEQSGAQFLEVQKALGHRIGVDRKENGFGFSNQLDPVDSAFCNLYAAFVGADGAAAGLAGLSATELEIQGGFKGTWIDRIRHQSPREVALAILQELVNFLQRHKDHPDPARRIEEPDQLIECGAAFYRLLANAMVDQAVDSEFERHRKALEKINVEVCGRGYRGFQAATTAVEEEPAELLSVWPDDVVGNKDYLAAGLRLARDVSGFDFVAGRNPKRLNPVLFGQGSPGCGKTVTAHAIGNFFLKYCRDRGVPARFLVIRRTDWASSFQNASATQLVKIFREQVQGFHGVVGVYWPDIDTAFAARSDPGMHSEESNILGASFGIFDGTLIPKNGKWFLICDANYMNMDEATLSRISQDPHKILGPASPEDYVELMRDKKLIEFADLIRLTPEEWLQVGQMCIDTGLSGRNVESICQKLLSEIQDVEPPEEYYKVDFEGRQKILRELAKPIVLDRILALMKQYKEFEKTAEAENEADRFKNRVKEIVLNLSAQQTAMESLER